MERLLLECAVRALLIALGTGAVLRAIRIRTPAACHKAWAGVMLLMLLLPVWTVWGPKASVAVLPTLGQSAGIESIAPIQVPLVGGFEPTPVPPEMLARSQRARGWDWGALLLGIYLSGVVALLVRLVVGMVRAQVLIRDARVCGVRLASTSCVAPITVGLFRPKMILPEGWSEWPAAQLDAVLIHENEHARRRDPLIQWLALINRALFWFHPLSWWLEQRLSALAEDACDDAVLAKGHKPHDYSGYLISLARATMSEGRLPHVAGATIHGRSVPERIHRMLRETVRFPISPLQRMSAVLACAASSILFVTAALEPAQAHRAEDLLQGVRQAQYQGFSSSEPLSTFWPDVDEWHLGEVKYIITGEELEAYAQLLTVGERDEFISQFWARRDPTPHTTENEFRNEYERRILYASEHFADPYQPAFFGFETDRGRIYAMFGPPDEIDSGTQARLTYERWRYGSVPEMEPEFAIRFYSSSLVSCGGAYKITSPEPIAIFEGESNASEAALPVSIKVFARGFVEIRMPVDFRGAVGVGWELRNGAEMLIDEGNLGAAPFSPDGDATSLFDAAGLGCTQALNRDSYTLSTRVRFGSGRIQSETVSFDVR